MEEPAKLPSFANCSCCGKPTFVDLLDEDIKCEYCRELKRIRPSRKKKHDVREK
jgi:hypothetical protein